MTTRKVLSITIDFDLTERKNGSGRLTDAHKAAVAAATEAVKSTLTPGSVEKVVTAMTYDYRWIAVASQTELPDDLPDGAALEACADFVGSGANQSR